ncbi:hypothetical protein EOD42_09890 [Rhodovarius crocodyli]|uniref:Uncharacterized protein n=1 Tax=Rhodovarius crocodyli TaxID=1979269 RepID=A0A437MGG3_9PROT|nr:hypothetical protein [Rhodovarius crocodyli]RVT96717.1 hypothetical protein EOD42_09890 [Rhodovarius crocodyli]
MLMLRAGIGLVAACAMLALVAWTGWLKTESLSEQVEEKLGIFRFLLEIYGVRDILLAYPAESTAILFGFIIGGTVPAAARDWLHERFLASFNDEVLAPVAERLRPDREDGPDISFVDLAWRPGTSPKRVAAWKTLMGWCQGQLAPDRQQRLSQAVLVGRTGAGKSRMAYELARHLARRDMLGGARPKATRSWRLGVYLRHALPGLRRRADDPWDAGLLLPGPGDADFTQFCERLKGWRPRRPTILLLDDPPPERLEEAGWLGQCWKALGAGRAFAHPVCLLVINQSVPPETGLTYEPATDSWQRGGKPADPPPVSLPAQQAFSEQETLEIAFASGHALGDLQTERTIRAQLYKVTEGNPLLIQLAIEWLRDGKPVERITAEALSDARAARILVAFEQRGVREDSQRAALALATLVGGASRERVEAGIARIWANATKLPEPAQLRACFPADPLQPGNDWRLPAIRPEIIGDVFIERVLAAMGPRHAIRLVEAACTVDAAAMLRGMRRTLRDPGSAMGQAMAAFDPDSVEEWLDPVEFALAWADVAIICQPDDTPTTAATRKASMEQALRAVERLDDEQKRAFCDGLTRLCDIPAERRAERQLRVPAAIRLMNHAANSMAGALPPGLWLTFFERTMFCELSDPGDLDGMARSAALLRTSRDIDRFAAALWDWFDGLRGKLAPVWGALFNADQDRPATDQEKTLRAARAARYATLASLSDPKQAHEAANLAMALAASTAPDAAILRELAMAHRYEADCWSRLPNGEGADRARQAADVTAALARQLPDDAALRQEEVLARSCEAVAWSIVPGGTASARAHEIAHEAAATAARFPADILLQQAAARTLQHEALAWCLVDRGGQSLRSRQATEAALAIARRFPGDRIMAMATAHAFYCASFAAANVPEGAQAAQAREAAEAAMACVLGVFDHGRSMRHAVAARANEAEAWSKIPHGIGADQARRSAAEAVAIARSFPDNINIQQSAVLARSHEAFAWNQVPQGAQANRSQAAADAAVALASRFPDEVEIQMEAATARRYEAYAWMCVPHGATALKVRKAADAVRDLAQPALHIPKAVHDMAEARFYEAYAWAEVPLGREAPRCAEAVKLTTDITSRHPDDIEMQRTAISAWSFATQAWVQVAGDSAAALAREAAQAGLDIARRFPTDIPIGKRAAEIRQWLARLDSPPTLERPRPPAPHSWPIAGSTYSWKPAPRSPGPPENP